MKRLILVIILAIILIKGTSTFVLGAEAQRDDPGEVRVDWQTKQIILDSTIQIRLIAPLLDEVGNPTYTEVAGQRQQQFIAGDGLGTVVHTGTETIIVTHDHWTLLTPTLLRVQFSNHLGDPLSAISGSEFEQRIRYRDGGTMIITAPDLALEGVGLGSNGQTGNQDSLYMTYRHPHTGKVDVVGASLIRRIDHEGVSAYRLNCPGGEFVDSGNSGGGIWNGPELVGNMWGAILEQNASFFDNIESGALEQTTISIAAQLPDALAQNAMK